jgi:hypothetical protein
MLFGILLLVASFFTAYVFGANTLGLIVGVISEDVGSVQADLLAIIRNRLPGELPAGLKMPVGSSGPA